MEKFSIIRFQRQVAKKWEEFKNDIPREHRKAMRSLIRVLIDSEDEADQEFDALMAAQGFDAPEKTEERMTIEEEMIAAAEDAEKAQAAGDKSYDWPLFMCQYCGDMYPIPDLTGAKKGLICYKCRHEMENRE